MNAKLGHDEYRSIMLKVQEYINKCKKEDRGIEVAVIVDVVINSITIKLSA